MTSQDAESVTFDQVNVGDVLTFLHRDNGFAGSGAVIDLVGTVTSKTDVSVRLRVDSRMPEFSGNFEVLRDAWSARKPLLINSSEVAR